MGHLFALWPVSPHFSHIVVCIRGQSFRLWPFASSVPSQLVHLCSGHAKLKALLWDVLPHSLHLCIRGQSFRLWPFGSSVPWKLLCWHTCVQDTRSSKRFCGSCCRIRPHEVHSDAECPDAPHLLQTRNLQPARFCLCPGSLHSVQYLAQTVSPVRCDSDPQ